MEETITPAMEHSFLPQSVSSSKGRNTAEERADCTAAAPPQQKQ